jgi:hypothetical protein
MALGEKRPWVECGGSIRKHSVPKYPNFWKEICDVRALNDSVGRTLILNSSAARRLFCVRFRQKFRRRDLKSVCSVSWQVVRVGLLATRRAGERHL